MKKISFIFGTRPEAIKLCPLVLALKQAGGREQRAEIRDQRAEIREQRAEIREQRAEIREQSAEIREQNAEIREQNAEIREQNAEIREQSAEIRVQSAEIREQSAEIREQSAEIREQRAESREQSAERTNHSALCTLHSALPLVPHVCVTGQHREMLRQVLDVFGVVPDVDLDLMTPNQTLAGFTSRAIDAIDRYLAEHRPDMVIVQGDTTTVFAASLAAFYHRIPVGHVEAGLRTGNKFSPFPEEINRVLTTRLADLHFAPTETSRDNLLRDGVPPERIVVTGNTVIDALFLAAEQVRQAGVRDEGPGVRDEAGGMSIDGLPDFLQAQSAKISAESRTQSAESGVQSENISALCAGTPAKQPWRSALPRVVLITGHRRENFGDGFERICRAIAELAEKFPDIHFVYPMHLNPNVREPVMRILQSAKSREQRAESRVQSAESKRGRDFSPGTSAESGNTSRNGAQRNDGTVMQSAESREQNAKSGKQDAVGKQNHSALCTLHSALPNVHLIEPLGYLSFVAMMMRADLILTDSGGVQEEAPSLGKPVLVMRDTTERPEAVSMGTVKLVGTDQALIVSEVTRLLTDQAAYDQMAAAVNPYGDGLACERIVRALQEWFCKEPLAPSH